MHIPCVGNDYRELAWSYVNDFRSVSIDLTCWLPMTNLVNGNNAFDDTDQFTPFHIPSSECSGPFQSA